MRYLIIGASGQVGNALYNELVQRDHSTVLGTEFSSDNNFAKLDIRDRLEAGKIIRDFQPSVIFLPAALTNVDYCEKNYKESYEINVFGTKHIVDLCKRDIKLVFYSSDYVFDGKNGSYAEDIPTNPISIYGQHKLIAENYVMTNCERYLIVRTNLVFGPDSRKKNYVYQILNKLQQNQEFSAPIDEFCTPTYSSDLAKYTLEILNQDYNNLVHIVGKFWISRFQFAQSVAEIFNLDSSLIKGVTSNSFGRAAQRPLAGGLRTKYNWPLIDSDYLVSLEKMKEIITWI